MFNILAKVIVGLLAGIGIFAVVSKLLNKYYENLAQEDFEFDMEDYDDFEDEILMDAPVSELDDEDTSI